MSAPLVIHLMRHGEPVLSGRFLGHTDSPSTPAGLAACTRAAEELAFEAVVGSDLLRARAPAEAVAAATGLPVRLDPRWRELNFGAWDGHAAATIDPAALARFWDDPDGSPPPDGERWSALVARVSAALAVLDRATLVVTHAGAMRAALAVLCGFGQRQLWAFDLPYAAVLSLALWRGEWPVAQITRLTA